MKGDFEKILENGVKLTVLAYRKPKKTEKTWNQKTGHIYAYVGLGGRGSRKGKSTKTFQL